MDDYALKALDASIEAWEKKRDAASPNDIRLGANDCPLCLYSNKVDGMDSCESCPVRIHTGNESCIGTPYSSALGAWYWWQQTFDTTRVQAMARVQARNKWVEAAQREVDFLKSLRPSDAS